MCVTNSTCSLNIVKIHRSLAFVADFASILSMSPAFWRIWRERRVIPDSDDKTRSSVWSEAGWGAVESLRRYNLSNTSTILI